MGFSFRELVSAAKNTKTGGTGTRKSGNLKSLLGVHVDDSMRSNIGKCLFLEEKTVAAWLREAISEKLERTLIHLKCPECGKVQDLNIFDMGRDILYGGYRYRCDVCKIEFHKCKKCLPIKDGSYYRRKTNRNDGFLCSFCFHFISTMAVDKETVDRFEANEANRLMIASKFFQKD